MSDEKVGYKRPPKHTRFKKGTSGNPKGRPKGSRNFLSELEEELNEAVVIREGGVPRRESKRRAVVKRLVEKALQGDPRAITTVAALDRDRMSETQTSGEVALGPDDRAILDAYFDQLQRTGARKDEDDDENH